MKLFVISVILIASIAESDFQARPQEVTCSCETPPGGTCRCDAGQVAICKIENKQCSTLCKTYPNTLSDRELAVAVLGDILDLAPNQFGFTMQGQRISETRSGESMKVVAGMLSTKGKHPTEYQAHLPAMYLKTAGTTSQDARVNVSLPLEIAKRLQQAQVQIMGK